MKQVYGQGNDPKLDSRVCRLEELVGGGIKHIKSDQTSNISALIDNLAKLPIATQVEQFWYFLRRISCVTYRSEVYSLHLFNFSITKTGLLLEFCYFSCLRKNYFWVVGVGAFVACLVNSLKLTHLHKYYNCFLIIITVING